MSSPAVSPARIDFSGSVPRSLDHGDIYHPKEGAHAQARHVFLQGNRLPQRWQGRRQFCILETGFGLGHNFLATWAAWQADTHRCDELHYVALELHPPCPEDLLRAHQFAALEPDGPPGHAARSRALVTAWPPLLSGLHALEFAGSSAAPDPGPGRVHLTLAFGDARQLLPRIVGRFDAFYLDGFAPSANPEMWDPWLLRGLARLAAPDATAATWSVAQPVREGLQAAGFAVERAPGFAAKREMTIAHFASRGLRRTPAGRPQGPWCGERHAVIVGAGLAGALAAQALAQRGWDCTVLDSADTPAQGASGNPAGLFHGVLHRDDGAHARLHRHAALAAARHYGPLIHSGTVPGGLDGLLAIRGERSTAGVTDVPAAPGLSGYAADLTQGEASRLAQASLCGPALHFLQGGWVDPAALVRHALASPGVHFQGNARVKALQAPVGGDPTWSLLDDAGRPLARAPLVVLAVGRGLPVLAEDMGREVSALGPQEVTRGQLTWFACHSTLRTPVTGHGYAVSLPDGRLLCGASQRQVDAQDQDDGLLQEDHEGNLARLLQLTGLRPAEGSALGGRVSWRVHTPDRLPLIGPAPRAELAPPVRRDQPRFIPRHPGLFIIGALGSRGLIWAPLASRLLCAWLDATPMPLEADLLDALDPCRWSVRQSRRAASTDRQVSTQGPSENPP
ncbi:MAG: FAD-dependent 5-carboxymethylaminomethyl-2-thiouridine(34) oxidoreductase MnmC [Betaproteobacteria bacterium]